MTFVLADDDFGQKEESKYIRLGKVRGRPTKASEIWSDGYIPGV
jgi:hypothetical protein